jgi:hypothetical protein
MGHRAWLNASCGNAIDASRDLDCAYRAAALVASSGDGFVMLGTAAQLTNHIDVHRGKVDLLLGRHRESIIQFDRVRNTTSELNVRLWLSVDFAHALIADRQIERAATVLRESWAFARQIGMRTLTARMEHLVHSDLAPYATLPAIRALTEEIVS